MIRTVVTRSSIFPLAILCFILINFADGRRLHSTDIGKRKGTIKTIESDDGDVIDCVDIYKQPAFDHPLLKNHTIESSSLKINNQVKGEKDYALKELQGWLKFGECPEGTVPIVRTPTKFAKYGPKKTHLKSRYYSKLIQPYNQRNASPSDDGHEYAEVSIFGGPYFGAKANINLWSPDPHGTMSISQIWVASSSDNYDELNTIEAGWVIGTGDPRTRFFIYWTSDGYRSTGCKNFDCPGFVQVSRMVAIGSVLEPISNYDGKQIFINVTIDQHKESGEWWLTFQNEAIGYWPNPIFTRLGNGANSLCWGGEIVNDEPNGHHSETQMGSGHFPDEGYTKSSCFTNVMYKDDSQTFKDADNLTTYVTKPLCYDIKVVNDNTAGQGTHFFYGGPGYSDQCPN
ncbi:hypothetical protein G4B88_013522 [Cannabis sativa]|uniref:Neprosin PEP catalytic domain-containing protein n=1 Tax=Cannabis sativa TaxID=3483 RepID=A0A7J6HM78_CANSA|nr:hypothetical protein G4B88_013522 [Cannabis sativa]